jgi:tetratricopeptide (TPR) repeat protein
MPFGTKPLDSVAAAARTGPDAALGPLIDFDAVYDCLLKPALEQAGYAVARGDSEPDPGDIRTSMFFELVTADLVVADITMMNSNVFYELGIREGACRRGVFTVRGLDTGTPPFDVASDRYFLYDHGLFLKDSNASPVDVDRAVQELGQRFKRAAQLDSTADSSPVYSHLPGLEPANWENIDTARSRYFGSLQKDWLLRVRQAQRAGRPGDILTLAASAPTRLHESKILYEAAIALIDLCRYEAAERVLSGIAADNPRAMLQHALVLSHLGRTDEAEAKLEILAEQSVDTAPVAQDLLGQVYRHLWHLAWCREQTAASRQSKAYASNFRAKQAIDAFLRAHNAEPRFYFAGFNALMLEFVLRSIWPKDQPFDVAIDREGLTATVAYVARAELAKARDEGNSNDHFWCTTTLAGIDFLQGHVSDALDKIRQACAIDTPTTFQLQSFEARLELIRELDIKSGFVDDTLVLVDDSIRQRTSTCSCTRLLVWLGPADASADLGLDWPEEVEQAFRLNVDEFLKSEHVGDHDLCVCAGLGESDIVFAEAVAALGAKIRIMHRAPVGEEARRRLWPLRSDRWQQRWETLTSKTSRNEIWTDTQFLGEINSDVNNDPSRLARDRHEQWILNTVEMEAQAVARADAVTRRTVCGIVWGEKDPADSSDRGAAFQRIRAIGGYTRMIRTALTAEQPVAKR